MQPHCSDKSANNNKRNVNIRKMNYAQWTRKLSPPLLDAVKVKVFFCWSNSDIMANTNANMYFDIKVVLFEYCTPSVYCADCCDSLPQSRGDSFRVHCVYVLLKHTHVHLTQLIFGAHFNSITLVLPCIPRFTRLI